MKNKDLKEEDKIEVVERLKKEIRNAEIINKVKNQTEINYGKEKK